MTGRHDLSGMQFGRLTAIAYERSDNAGTWWRCQCECGTERIFRAGNLRSGNSQSCGCVAREKTAARNAKYGDLPKQFPAEYNIWRCMWKRTTIPGQRSYAKYKDRRPPDSWRDFSVFFAEIGARPTPAHTLERTDNNAPYGPGNVCWATPAQQARNKSNNKLITHDGITLCQRDWAERLGVADKHVTRRLRRLRRMSNSEVDS